MGRPLFMAKVETDLPSEKTASYARSPIRRTRRTGRSSQAFSDLQRQMDENLSTLRANAREAARADVRNNARALAVNRDSIPREDTTLHHAWEMNRIRMRRISRGQAAPSAARPANDEELPVPPPRPNDELRAHVARLWQDHERHSPRGTRISPRRTRATDSWDVDGLGDRNRSLSPEDGRDVWDTLLTTITPDPQPPSVGSSFASTVAASHSAGTRSAATSFTEPERVPEMDTGCESGAEDREEESDDDEPHIISTLGRPPRVPTPRSHPSVDMWRRIARQGNNSSNPSVIQQELDDIIAVVRTFRSEVPASFWTDLESLRGEI